MGEDDRLLLAIIVDVGKEHASDVALPPLGVPIVRRRMRFEPGEQLRAARADVGTHELSPAAALGCHAHAVEAETKRPANEPTQGLTHRRSPLSPARCRRDG
jgi:hypothetical protein